MTANEAAELWTEAVCLALGGGFIVGAIIAFTNSWRV